MSNSLDILCPHGCYRHKRLILVDKDNQVYEGICLDCRQKLIYQSVVLVEDLTDSQTIFFESQRDRQLVNDIKSLGEDFEDLALEVSNKLTKARLLK